MRCTVEPTLIAILSDINVPGMERAVAARQ
jgi:hypothetical protein